jgi:4-amino-4-deoxy-L-arabinose transferase-like glycosyltransferase
MTLVMGTGYLLTFRRFLRRLLASRRLYSMAAIFALAFVLRLAWVSYLDIGPMVDGWGYFYGASTLASGHDLRNFWDRSSYLFNFPPGYPMALSGLFVLFGSDVFVAKLFNVVLGAVTAVLVYVLATRFRDERTGVVAGVLMAFFPSQIYFTMMIMTETFFSALSVVLLLLLVGWVGSQSSMKSWQVLVLGLLLGFMSLVRAETPLVAVTLVALWKVCGHHWRQIGRSLLLLVAGMTLMIGPWTVRNYIRTDKLILVRGAGSDAPLHALRVGLSPDFYDPKFHFGVTEPPSAGDLAEYYATHPWEVPKHGARKLVRLFGHENVFYWVDLLGKPYITSETASRWAALGDAFYYVVGLVALLGAPLWFRRRDRPLLVLLWFAISWSAVHLVFVPEERYHYPILPVACVLAAVTLVSVWDRLTQGRTSPAPPGPPTNIPA